MLSRRAFIGTAAAAGTMAGTGWAALGGPAYLSAARWPDGRFALCGLADDGTILFGLDLPGRGHAAAAHPRRAQAVAFARRPGGFALVIDCASGAVVRELAAPSGRHFYGHGAFSVDGSRLYTTENDFDAARGVIGVWDAEGGYGRVGEFASGGVGPHEILRLPASDVLAVANGGIETHPDAGRAKLNLPFMRPNLAYLDPEGETLEIVEHPDAWRRNSIRHLAASADGRIAAAFQWQGEAADTPPLLALHERGGQFRYLSAGEGEERRMQGYAGSTAFSDDGALVAFTAPRGGALQVFDATSGAHRATLPMTDVCGIAAAAGGFAVTSGGGAVAWAGRDGLHRLALDRIAWDNHLVRIG
ncbi:MAG: DUF1513 domain-containing protein [Jhaorihella sp.]